MGVLSVVGIGGGNKAGMTFEAYAALDKADVIVGYTTYIQLITPLFPQKKYHATGMMQERERCQKALALAQTTKQVVIVCSGDAGVYGMASLVYELIATESVEDVAVRVIAGVTAALGGAALLGAPLSHDFCVISLSDALTPQNLIDKRLRAAAEADFCIALYNPRSNHRPHSLKHACAILLETRAPQTICGWVRNIGRTEEEYTVCTLATLADEPLDMFCTAFVGNSATSVTTVCGKQKMVTPRGYHR